MNNEEIIRMAREAGFEPNSSTTVLPMKDYASHSVSYELESFAALVAANERENCANLREEIILYGAPNEDYEDGFWDGLAAYEAAIKARGHK